MKLTDEQLMDILKEAVKAIAIKYNSIVADNEIGEVTQPVTEVAPKEIPKKVEIPQEPKVESPKPVEKAEVTNEEVIEDTNRNGEETPHSSREVLEEMSYNELKVLAKETGVKAIGNKQTLIDKILEAQMSTIDPNTTQTTEEIEETKEETQPPVEEEQVQEPQVENAQEEDEDTVEFDEEPIEDQEEDEDNLYNRLVKETMDMSDEEIADLLADVGISPKGRRQALLSKLEQAVRDGLIAFGDDEDEEDTEEVSETPAQDYTDVDYTDVDEEEENSDDNEEVIEIAGSEERVAKVEELYEKYITQYMNDEISDKEILDFLKDYYNDENSHEYKSLVENATNEELADHYCLIHAQLVDDDGEEYDWGQPYIVEDEYWCSGKPMKMLDDNTLYDEVTGEQFELE